MSVNPLQQYPTDFFPTLGTRETKQDDTQFNLSDLTNLLGDKKEEKFVPSKALEEAFKGRSTNQTYLNF